MTNLLPLGYAAIRTGGAVVLAGRAHARGAALGTIVAQGVSDVSLALGIIAFGEPRVAQLLGGLLALLVAYATIWESYVAAVRVGERLQDVPGADLSAASIGRPIFGIWEALAVIPSILMAGFGANARLGSGRYLFESNALDALIAAIAGIVVLVWVRRWPPLSQGVRLLLSGLGILLLITALWVWL